MSYESERRLQDLRKWISYNQSQFDKMDIDMRLQYLLDGIRGMMSVLIETVGDIQKLEGRVPGDKDDKSTFPFPDSLADKKRTGEGSSLIVPVGRVF